MKVFFVGDCKGFSHFTQVIWGHWVLGQDSDTIFDSLFSQKIFFDALTRTTRNHTKTSTPAPNISAIVNARNSLNSSQLDLICKDYIRSSVAAASAISSRSAVPHTATPATHAHNKKEVTVSPRSIRTYATTAKTTTKLKLISAKPIVATPRKLVNTRNIGTIPFNFAPSGKPLNLQSTASVIKSLLTNPTVTPNLPTATTKSNSVTTPPQPKSSSNWGNFISNRQKMFTPYGNINPLLQSSSNRQKMFTPYGNINPLLQSSSTTSKVDLNGIFQTSSTILKPNINPMPPSTSAPFT
ncbi:hypothetical protein QE152_g19035 [Popillia japonica]|uniref:Uncharacterized protein n=1 Tax=Popillia japonica TaxID=7064 RepID=A0AAW1L1S2_POPJA